MLPVGVNCLWIPCSYQWCCRLSGIHHAEGSIAHRRPSLGRAEEPSVLSCSDECDFIVSQAKSPEELCAEAERLLSESSTAIIPAITAYDKAARAAEPGTYSFFFACVLSLKVSLFLVLLYQWVCTDFAGRIKAHALSCKYFLQVRMGLLGSPAADATISAALAEYRRLDANSDNASSASELHSVFQRYIALYSDPKFTSTW